MINLIKNSDTFKGVWVKTNFKKIKNKKIKTTVYVTKYPIIDESTGYYEKPEAYFIYKNKLIKFDPSKNWEKAEEINNREIIIGMFDYSNL